MAVQIWSYSENSFQYTQVLPFNTTRLLSLTCVRQILYTISHLHTDVLMQTYRHNITHRAPARVRSTCQCHWGHADVWLPFEGTRGPEEKWQTAVIYKFSIFKCQLLQWVLMLKEPSSYVCNNLPPIIYTYSINCRSEQHMKDSWFVYNFLGQHFCTVHLFGVKKVCFCSSSY